MRCYLITARWQKREMSTFSVDEDMEQWERYKNASVGKKVSIIFIKLTGPVPHGSLLFLGVCPKENMYVPWGNFCS
jgi:hypothetical protein